MDSLETFEILVAEHERMLLTYVRGIVKDPSTAQDIAQEAFVKAFQNLASLQKKEAFPAWLRTIARNLALSEIKKRALTIPTDPEILEGMEDVFSRLDDHELGDTWAERLQSIKDCFQHLPDTLQETCRLHYFKNQKTADIAAALAVELATVLKRLERGRTAIRECVEKNLALT